MASAYRIGPYCRTILSATENTRKPIYTWDCFNLKNCSAQDLVAYVNEIADALRSYDIAEELDLIRFGKTFSQDIKTYAILYLIRCALIARLADDWGLTYRPEYDKNIGLTTVYQGLASKFIDIGERGLSRNPIESGSEVQCYTLRIAAEAGFPLRSLQGKDTKAVRGLRSIYYLHSSSLPKSDQLKVVSSFIANGAGIKPDSSYFWLPGGKTGAREFYTQGSSLLGQIDFIKKKNESLSEIEILRQLGFINPSEEVVDYIFKNKTPLNISLPSVRPTLFTATHTAGIVRSQNQITPTDWARSHKMSVDFVMKLLRNAGVPVTSQFSRLESAEYRKIAARAEEYKNSFKRDNVVTTKTNSLGLKVRIIRPKDQG